MATDLETLKKRYLRAKAAYYNKEPIMTDAQFDSLEDRIKAADPKWSELKATGVKVKKKPVALVKPMPSLLKAYPDEMPKFLAKHGTEFIIMDKLDGSSLQIVYRNGKPTKAITRGDGTTGGDISFLLPSLKLPTLKSGNFVLRCEAVMPDKVFKKKWAKTFDNARNGVNGILNRTDSHPALADIKIVVLGVYGVKIGQGLLECARQGFDVVPYCVGKVTQVETLTKRLELRRAHGPFEIDGLVVAPLGFVLDYENADKPKNIIAFKINDEANAQVVKVKRIIWQVTGHGRIIPKIEIEPTQMDGVMVKHATSHNAKWMQDRGIGPGALIKVLRSGGVIPKIVGVKKAGKFQEPDMEYELKGVHFYHMHDDESVQRTEVLQCLKFMRTMGIEHVADKTITAVSGKFVKPDAWLRRWHMGTLQKRLVENGIGPKMSAVIVSEFDRVFANPVPISKLMVASHAFDPGVGLRRLNMLEKAGINLKSLIYMKRVSAIASMCEVKGFSEKTAALIADGMAFFEPMYEQYLKYLTIDDKPAKIVKKSGKFNGTCFTFTGYRDDEQAKYITDNGGEIVPFGSRTNVLLYKEGGKLSSKIEKAQSKGFKVLTFDQL